MKMKRALVALAMTVGAVGVPMVTATSAQATQSQCTNYLTSKGYLVGPKLRQACSYGTVLGGPSPSCIAILLNTRVVAPSHAQSACSRA
ncbi:hypothetical protein [Streptomyces sp. NPDC127033]|uniref:hypothetical protein n=1 Tax=Streptomyces sp. NPDC127033 TaxID=3347110 RepID=UPI00366A266B